MISQKSLIICALVVSCALATKEWNDPKDQWGYSLAGHEWEHNTVLYVNQCGSPLAQSPINIPDDQVTKTNQVKLTVEWYNQKQDVDIEFKQGALRSEGIFSILRMKSGVLDLDYYSTYMEYHAPGQNELHGEFYDLELQIYHRLYEKHATRQGTKEAVVSILFRKSYEAHKNPFFEQWDFSNVNFDGSNVADVKGKATLNIDSLSKQLEDNTDFYNFLGSYTRPPCTENLNWFVFDQVLEINYEQLKELNKFYRFNPDFANGRGNAREIQALNLPQRNLVKGEAKFVYPLDFESDDETDDESNEAANLVHRTIIHQKKKSKRHSKNKKTKIENIY